MCDGPPVLVCRPLHRIHPPCLCCLQSGGLCPSTPLLFRSPICTRLACVFMSLSFSPRHRQSLGRHCSLLVDVAVFSSLVFLSSIVVPFDRNQQKKIASDCYCFGIERAPRIVSTRFVHRPNQDLKMPSSLLL